MMRNPVLRVSAALFACAVLLLPVGRSTASVPLMPTAERLLRVATADRDQLAALALAGGRPVWVASDYALVLAGEADEALPELRRLDPVVLGPWDPRLATYVVDLERPRGTGLRVEDLGGRILYRDARTAVVAIARERELRVTEAFEAAWIPGRTLRFAPAAARAVIAPPERDPAIREMVDQVDRDTLRARVQALQDLRERVSSLLGGAAAQHDLVRLFRRYGYAQVDSFPIPAHPEWCADVIATRLGLLHPERIVVVGAHYDSYSRGGDAPGADDNASGTAGVLELARIFGREAFESTILFAAWSGEEQGLHGSAAWAAWAADQGLDIRGYLNLDMEGYLGGEQDLDVISNDADAGSVALRDLVFAVVPLYVPGFPVVDGFLAHGGSDHQSFWNNGFPAVFFFEDSNRSSPYIHTSNDVIGTSLNSFEFMQNNVRAAAATVAALAGPVSIRIEHTPVAAGPDTSGPLPVVCRIAAVRPVVADSVSLFFRTGSGPFVRLRMEPTGEPDEYAAFIPAPPGGARVEYYLRARDGAGHVMTDPRSAPGSVHHFRAAVRDLWADDFETDRGWTVGAPGDGAVSGLWTRADPVGAPYQPEDDATPGEGGACYVTGNSPAGVPEEDVDGGATSLTSPRIDLAGVRYAEVSWSSWYADENRLDDTLRVLVSNDDGRTWRTLHRTERSAPVWSRIVVEDLGSVLPLTTDMLLRFLAEDCGGPSVVEAAIDDVVLSAYVPAGVPVPGPVPLGRGLTVRPNPPPRGLARIEFDLDVPGPVRLTVHDLLGRELRVLEACSMQGGPHSLLWDLADAGGRPVPAGVYFVRLRAGGRTLRARLVVPGK